MIKPIRLPARVPVLALLVLALATLAIISLVRITTGAAARPEVATPSVIAAEPALADRPVTVQAVNQTGCASSIYVSGDIAGDRSPAEIYAAMCGKP